MMCVLSRCPKSLGDASIMVYLFVFATVFWPVIQAKQQSYEWNYQQNTGDHFLYGAHIFWRCGVASLLDIK